MPKLGINIDHVATLRQARREQDPNPIQAALIAEKAGADTIVCHLREDRRHIQDKDVVKIKKRCKKPINLEMSLNPGIVRFAARIKPTYCMFVPEKRQEITTEGGLDIIKYERKLRNAIKILQSKGIIISVFIDAKKSHIDMAKKVGAEVIELHTGPYANAKTVKSKQTHLKRIKTAAKYAKSLDLTVHAGHGLKYNNVRSIARIRHIDELNIGHAIISEAVFSGLPKAVKRMKKLVQT